MLFQQDSLVFQLYDILYLQQGYSKSRNKNRHYDALSFRIRAKTVIECEGNRINLQNGSIAYFPSNFEYTRIAELDDLIVVHFKCYNYSGRKLEHFVPHDPDAYSFLFHQLLDCWRKKEPGYKHQATSIFAQILQMIYCENIPESVADSKIDASIQYIRENLLQTDFTLTEAARKSYVSDVYFRKLFKEKYGITPKQYVIQHRIQQAASLILAGFFSLQQIAEICGYRDYKHFTTEFKRIMGVSPSKYEYNHHVPK